MSKHTTPSAAQDIMTADPVCCEPGTTIRQLARLFEQNDISGCPVVNPSGRVIGVVSKTDLIRRCAQGTRDIPPAYLFEIISEQDDDEAGAAPMPEALVCVQDFMTESAVTVHPEMPTHEVAAILADRRIHRVIVVDEEEFPLGIITSLDVLKHFPRPAR